MTCGSAARRMADSCEDKWPTNDVIDNFIGQYVATHFKFGGPISYRKTTVLDRYD